MSRPGVSRRTQHAFSYVEVVLATCILGICLVPALRALPVVLESHRVVSTKYHLSLVAQEKMEAALTLLSSSLREWQDQGDLADRGHSDWRYDVLVTFPPEGEGTYATLRARAWVDCDPDGSPGPGELLVRFDTLVFNRQAEP